MSVWKAVTSWAWLLGLISLVVLWIYLERPPEQVPGVVVLRMVVNSSERDQVYARLIKQGFEKAHPDIRIQFIKAGEGDKKGTMIAGGDAPDVVNIGAGEEFWRYTDAGVLRDLTPFLTPADVKDLEGDFFRVPREAMMKDGKYYAMPWNLIPFILFYNKRLFDRYDVPYPNENWTWADFESAARKLTIDKNNDGFPEIFGTGFATWQEGYYTWFYQNGAQVLSEDGKRVDINNPKAVEALEYLQRLTREYDAMPTQTNRPQNVGSGGLFASDRQAMIGPTGSFFIPQFRGKDFEKVDWDIAPLPKGPTGIRSAAVASGGFGVTTQSEHPQEAFELVKYLTGPEGQARLAESALFVPARASIARDMSLMNPTGKPEHMEAVIHAVENDYAFVSPWTGRRWSEFTGFLNEDLNNFLFAKEKPGLTAEMVLQKLEDRGNFLLAEEANERAGAPLPTGFLLRLGLGSAAVLLLAWGIRVVKEARKTRVRGAEQIYGYLAIAPWLVGFIVFAAGPILFSIILSVCRWNNLAPPSQARYIGFENYATLLGGKDEFFFKSLIVTAKYTIWAVPMGLVAGLILALFMNAKIRGINYYRTIFYLPAILPGIATTMLWTQLFKQNGLLNWALSPVWTVLPLVYALLAVTGFALAAFFLWSVVSTRLDDKGDGRWTNRPVYYFLAAVAAALAGRWIWQFGSFSINWSRIADFHQMPDWLLDPSYTVPAILIMGLWAVGGGMMIYLAGLQNIPTDLYNAAEVDGAGPLAQFRHVTLPMISPVLFFNLVMGIIGTFQVFGSAFVLFGSSGGPEGSALFYGLYLYRKAFEQFDIGMGAALAWILFVIILAFTLLIFRSSSLWVYYEGTKEGKA